MSSVVANESFACEWGMIHQGSVWPAGHAVVKAFPQFFDGALHEAAPAKAPAKKAAVKKAAPRKATNG